MKRLTQATRQRVEQLAAEQGTFAGQFIP